MSTSSASETGRAPGVKGIVHIHCAVSDQTGKVTGGHLLEAPVSATLEVFLTQEPTPIRKVLDDRLGLKLIE